MKDFKGFDKQSIFKFAQQDESPETLLKKDICVVRERSWNGDNVYLATKNIELAERLINEVDGLSSIEYVAILNAYNRGKTDKNISSERVISFRCILGLWHVRVENLDTADLDIQVTSLLNVAQAYEYVSKKLKSGEFLVLYKTGLGYKLIHTTLNQVILSNWPNTSSAREVTQVIKQFDSPNNIAEIVVPDLDRFEPSYERINLMDIIEVKVIDE